MPVVLRHTDYGEADRLLTLYTRQFGKTRALAKRARKIASRKAGHIEPFTYVKLQLARGRDMPLVTQADTVDAYLPLREDLVLTTLAAYVIELIDRFTYEEGENRALYRLLADTLSRLCTSPNPDLAVRYYEMRLLDLLGFRRQLTQCAKCDNDIQPEDQYFLRNKGGCSVLNVAPISPACGQGFLL